jgi:hypothetical protein
MSTTTRSCSREASQFTAECQGLPAAAQHSPGLQRSSPSKSHHTLPSSPFCRQENGGQTIYTGKEFSKRQRQNVSWALNPHSPQVPDGEAKGGARLRTVTSPTLPLCVTVFKVETTQPRLQDQRESLSVGLSFRGPLHQAHGMVTGSPKLRPPLPRGFKSHPIPGWSSQTPPP